MVLSSIQAADAVDLDSGMTAFHIACDANQPECAEELARAGCDVGLKDANGKTGREVAEVEGHAAVVERLRAVVGEQLRAAQAVVRPSSISDTPEPSDAAGAGVSRLCDWSAIVYNRGSLSIAVG